MMLKKLFSLTSAVIASIAFFFGGCGPIVEQNELALVLKTLGEREVQTVNIGGKGAGDNFSSELITARRAPMQRPGIKVFKFPLGLQVYEFSGRASLESPENEALTVNPMGGQATFNLVVQLHIDTGAPDLKNRLVKLIKDYQLMQYAGANDLLEKLIAGRFSKMIMQPFIEYSADKKTFDLIRGKKELNRFVMDFLNKKFNSYALKFDLVGVSSAISMPHDQQEQMNEIVTQVMDLQVLEITNKKIKPLDAQIAQNRQDGQTSAAAIINQAKADRIDKITAAQKERKDAFIGLIGVDNYVNLETMLMMAEGLKSGKTKINIVPKDTRVYLTENK